MSWLLPAAVTALTAFASSVHGQPATPDNFSGLYAGAEVGPVSYNTQITFNGVDDPAGRGGFLYGAFVGYGHVHKNWLLGVEGSISRPSTPDPYTFDARVTGFEKLDLQRGLEWSLDARAGRVFFGRVLLHGSLGFVVTRQSVDLDGVPLSTIAGASDAVTFGVVQLGAGTEVAVVPRIGIRFVFRTLSGLDLDAADFGGALSETTLTFFDVEPRLHQFMFGLRYQM